MGGPRPISCFGRRQCGGVSGGGKTIDTAAIQKAIDAAAAARGTVVFQPGVYLSGSLFLKSGVRFRVDQGVEIRGVQD
jgi:polygalacturonase